MPWSKELYGHGLSPLHRTRLYCAGYKTRADLSSVSAQQLSKDTGLNQEDCQHIINSVFCPSCPRKAAARHRSALDLYQEQLDSPSIITFSEKLDQALGGGVQIGQLTEICGTPGTGKTQFCLQLTVDVQIPAALGGVGGEAVFIDTKGTFLVERFKEIAAAAVKHCQIIADSNDIKESEEALKEMSMDTVLSRIQYFGCHDYLQLLASVEALPQLLEKNKKIKLLVIDSVAFLFRDFEDMFFRTRLLTSLGQRLLQLAKDFQLAVVVTNQMTTRVRSGSEGDSQLVPALGDSWGHSCTVRLILRWDWKQRTALLQKSLSQPRVTVPFQITMDGVRDILEEVPDSGNIDRNQDSENQPSKRQRIS